MCVRLVELFGSPLPRRPRRFRRNPWFVPHAVPCSLAKTGSSSCELHASSESSHPVPAPSLPRQSAFHGVAIPLGDISQKHRCNGFPHPPPSALGVSHALDGLSRFQPCGFISPRCHLQGSPFRGLLLLHSRAASSASLCPLVGWPTNAADSCPSAPRLLAPPSGLCSVSESVTCT